MLWPVKANGLAYGAKKVPLTVIHGWRFGTAGPVGQLMPFAPDIAQEVGAERAKLRVSPSLVGFVCVERW